MNPFSWLKPSLMMKKCDWAEIMADENYDLLIKRIRKRYHKDLDILRNEILGIIHSSNYKYDDLLTFTIPSHSCKHTILRLLYSWSARLV